MEAQPRLPVPFYREDGEHIICDICPVHCRLKEGAKGVCQGRQVLDGTLVATNFCRVAAMHLDPIEKKPLFHVYPGNVIMSSGVNGCNLHCKWCQNCDLSQGHVPSRYMAPDELAGSARSGGSIGMAYTYSEPFIWFETLQVVMPLVRERGGINVLVSNGQVEEETLEALLPWIDAANIDLKFMESDAYRKYTGGDLEATQRTIRRMHDAGVMVEVTHLMVTDLTDKEGYVAQLASWLADIDAKIPLHLSRYFPRHRWESPPTSRGALMRGYQEAKEHLAFVYVGNIDLENGQDTVCPSCGNVAVRRSYYRTAVAGLSGEGFCSECGEDLHFRMPIEP